MSDIIKLEKVTKTYDRGQRAVNGVSLSIKEKEYVVIYGDVGSGKSTLMRLIAGLQKPTDGKIIIFDRVVNELNSEAASAFRNMNFGIMQRNPCFMGNINLLDNVALPLAIRGTAPSVRIAAAKKLLETLELLYAAEAYPSQISGYEAQKAALARALITQPKILLLDEVMGSLSIKEAEQLFGILGDFRKSGDYIIVSFSGTKNSILPADRYFTLDHGSIQEDIS